MLYILASFLDSQLSYLFSLIWQFVPRLRLLKYNYDCVVECGTALFYLAIPRHKCVLCQKHIVMSFLSSWALVANIYYQHLRLPSQASKEIHTITLQLYTCCNQNLFLPLDLFPGLPHLQFLIACSVQYCLLQELEAGKPTTSCWECTAPSFTCFVQGSSSPKQERDYIPWFQQHDYWLARQWIRFRAGISARFCLHTAPHP